MQVSEKYLDVKLFVQCSVISGFNSLPNNKILDWSKLTHSHTMTPFDAPGKPVF